MKDDKDNYLVNYTLKGESGGWHSQTFKTKDEALLWVKKNPLIYWSQVVSMDAKSLLPRPIVTGEVDQSYQCYSGNFGTYYETGMEYLALVFERDDIKGSPNPNYDKTKPESASNFQFFKDFSGLILLKQGDILLLPSGDRVFLLRDRVFAREDGFRLGFYPQGFSRKELLELFVPGNVKSKIWVKKSDQ